VITLSIEIKHDPSFDEFLDYINQLPDVELDGYINMFYNLPDKNYLQDYFRLIISWEKERREKNWQIAFCDVYNAHVALIRDQLLADPTSSNLSQLERNFQCSPDQLNNSLFPMTIEMNGELQKYQLGCEIKISWELDMDLWRIIGIWYDLQPFITRNNNVINNAIGEENITHFALKWDVTEQEIQVILNAVIELELEITGKIKELLDEQKTNA
jgi:hypothetical protein